MQNNKNIFIVLIAFLVAQPIIDVLTAGSILLLNLDVTFGVIIRTVYMVLMGIVIVWMAKSDKLSRGYLFYFIGLALLIGVNIALNMQVKDPYYLMQELKFFNKVIYFHVVLLGFIIIYRNLKEANWNIERHTTRYLWLSGFIIGAVFVIAQLTGTSLSNYAHSKTGFKGWFFAGNEIGAIMAIVLPIVALYAIEKTASLKKSHYWIPFIMLSLGMLALGTKVGYAGIVIVLLSIIIGSIIMWVFMKLRTMQVKSNLLISTILLIMLMAVTPLTPVFGNMYAHFDILNLNFGPNDPVIGPNGEIIEEETPAITEEQLQNLVFSSREKYLENFQVDFNSSPITQKLFGMGFAGNYEVPEEGKQLTMIEMDFHDLFFAFGWIGFFYMMAPFFYYVLRFIIRFLANIKTHFNYVYILYGVAFLLGVGIAFTAGHVLTAPAASIYLAAILAMLVVKEDIVKS